jgi:general secretion pathway protein E
MRKADSTTIGRKAIEEGMRTLREDGSRKVIEGITTLEEVVRVTQE